MNRALLLLFALACGPLVAAQPEDPAARIDRIAQEALDVGPIAGLSIAVVQNGQVLHVRGYGVMNAITGAPATAETLFNPASVGKIIAAVAVMQLVDEGRLDLDADLAMLLPSFPNPEQGRRITLRQLLSHTSGLSDYVAAGYERWEETGEPLAPRFVLEYVRDRPLDFEPGTHWIYSNTGFYLAGLIVERVTGRPWGEVVIDEVARPLGLDSVILCDDAGDRRSVGYDVTDGGFIPSDQDSEQGVRGDAGLCATALDLARLPGALVTSGLLSDASLHTMLSPTVLTSGVPVDYGLGVARGSLDGHPLWGHLGGNGSSYVATLAHYPDDDMTIAVLVNTRFGSVGALLLEGKIAEVVLGLDTPTLEDEPLAPEARQVYLGDYEGERRRNRMRIVEEDGHLKRTVLTDERSEPTLLAQGDHAFGRADWPMDRYVFHVVGDQALAYSDYYYGLFDGFYRREEPFDLVIANGRVMDPETGLDDIRHLGITDGTIRAISEAPLAGHETLDARSRVVAPGFIDVNTYQHGDALFRLRAADGVTSVLHLEDGAVDVAAYYDALAGQALIHYGISVGHGGLRHVAQGDTTQEVFNGMTDWPGINETRAMPELDQRGLTEAEKDTLAALVEQGMREGAVAVGFAIEYSPGATHSEILRMFELAAQYDASAHIHVRSFDTTREWGELYEVLAGAIHTGGDLHVNHLQSFYGSYTGPALAFIGRARSVGLSITTECYPYTAGSTFIDSALFDDWEDWPDERFQRFEWTATGERLTRETFARYRAEGGIIVIHARDEAAQEVAVRTCLAHPLPMIASDGAWDSGQTHPRVSGTNSRVLGRYVREEGVLTLMDALRKMSLAPAQHLEHRVPGMRRKGRVQVGADADLVVFDPATVMDRATYSEPLLPPVGIETVLVLGVPVVRHGAIQDDVFPGHPIRGPLSD